MRGGAYVLIHKAQKILKIDSIIYIDLSTEIL
jgi:hypothetical protein